jgi:hypothetical protein
MLQCYKIGYTVVTLTNQDNTMKTLEVIGLAFESLMFFAVLPALVVFPFFL